MRLKYCILISCLLFSCKIESQDIKENISYVQDPKTEICFAEGCCLLILNISKYLPMFLVLKR